MPKQRITTEIFKERCGKIFNNKYDYSLVEYKTGAKVKIICPIHGQFEQFSNSHLSGKHCSKCAAIAHGINARKTNDEFIKEARELHGSKYDYTKVEYVTTTTKVIIGCPKHGEFLQSPGLHIRGSGCLACVNEDQTKSQEVYIKEAKEVHGDKYDYSKVLYVNAKNKVTIICPEHGEFEKDAFAHLRGGGCPDCGLVSTGIKNSISESEFFDRVKSVHGDIYTYGKYKNLTTAINIECKQHGIFTQIPAQHLITNGCPHCSRSVNRFSYKLRCQDPEFAKLPGCVYVVQLSKDGEVFGKIGVSIRYKLRLTRYRSEGMEVKEIAQYPMTALESLNVEDTVLSYISKFGEKYVPSFYFPGRSECFDIKKLSDVVNILEDHLPYGCKNDTEYQEPLDFTETIGYNDCSVDEYHRSFLTLAELEYFKL